MTLVNFGSKGKPSTYRKNEDWCCRLLVFILKTPAQMTMTLTIEPITRTNILPVQLKRIKIKGERGNPRDFCSMTRLYIHVSSPSSSSDHNLFSHLIKPIRSQFWVTVLFIPWLTTTIAAFQLLQPACFELLLLVIDLFFARLYIRCIYASYL